MYCIVLVALFEISVSFTDSVKYTFLSSMVPMIPITFLFAWVKKLNLLILPGAYSTIMPSNAVKFPGDVFVGPAIST